MNFIWLINKKIFYSINLFFWFYFFNISSLFKNFNYKYLKSLLCNSLFIIKMKINLIFLTCLKLFVFMFESKSCPVQMIIAINVLSWINLKYLFKIRH